MKRRVAQTKILHLYSQQEGKCYYCGQTLEISQDSRVGVSVDHKIPQSRGGSNDLDNLVLCCRSCNILKSNHMEFELLDCLARIYRGLNIVDQMSLKDWIKAVRDGFELSLRSEVSPAQAVQAVLNVSPIEETKTLLGFARELESELADDKNGTNLLSL